MAPLQGATRQKNYLPTTFTFTTCRAASTVLVSDRARLRGDSNITVKSQPSQGQVIKQDVNMSVVNNGVDLVKWQLDRARRQVSQSQVYLESAAAKAESRLNEDARRESILQAGHMNLMLPEYPVAMAMLANAQQRALQLGSSAVPALPAGSLEEHEAAMRTAYTLLGFLASTEPNSVLLITSTISREETPAPAAPVAPAVATTASAALTCDQCGKVFTKSRFRDRHVKNIHSVPLTPDVYDMDNPACWGKSRCRYIACEARKNPNYVGAGCDASLNPVATRQAHQAIVDKWGTWELRRESEESGGNLQTSIVAGALHADAALLRHLGKHGQHRPRGQNSKDFGGLGTVQVKYVKAQVSRLLELEEERGASDPTILTRMREVNDNFYGLMRDKVIPTALAQWNNVSYNGSKRRKELDIQSVSKRRCV